MHQIANDKQGLPVSLAKAPAVGLTAGPVMKTLPGPHRDAVLPGLARLSGIILLAGSVRPSPLTQATGRSPLSLPLANDHTLLDVWRRQALVLAGRAKLERLAVRIIVDRSSAAPALTSEDIDAGLNVEVDPVELRGTAGVLKDVTAAYDDDAFVLTASAAQLMTESLVDLATDLAARQSDLAVAVQADGSPSSVMLIRCGCLKHISSVGFIDLKEQAIPQIAARHSASVAWRTGRTEHQVRTLSDYVSAVRLHQRQVAGATTGDDPFAERWESSAAVVEGGATVDPSATLHDSIVLTGGRVERNATLVRSVVCAGGVVRRGQVVVDRFVTR
jgi:hypothetical protein